jgi:hypothetical protein
MSDITLSETTAAIHCIPEFSLGHLLEDILRNQWIVLSGLRSLRIASKDGGPCNEYRIQKHSVEFRSVGTDGKPYTRESGMWRPLNGEEIQLHFALQTPVAEWLDKTLYSPAPSA